MRLSVDLCPVGLSNSKFGSHGLPQMKFLLEVPVARVNCCLKGVAPWRSPAEYPTQLKYKSHVWIGTG